METVNRPVEGATFEEKQALEIFFQHEKDYPLDEGGLEERYDAAYQMTCDLFFGTPYYVNVETYCAYCTVSRLYKRVSCAEYEVTLKVRIMEPDDSKVEELKQHDWYFDLNIPGLMCAYAESIAEK